MVDIPGCGTQRDLEGMVNAAGNELQVPCTGVICHAGDIEIWECTVNVQACLLAERSSTKDPYHWDLLHRTGPEVRVAYIQVFGGWAGVGINGYNTTAEDTGREGGGDRGGERRGGATSPAHSVCHQTPRLGVIIFL